MPFSKFRTPEWVAIGAAVILVFLSWMTYRAYADAERTVRRTSTTRREATLTKDAIQAAQRGQRGFLLTGDEKYLRPYHVGVRETQIHLARLQDLVISDPAQLSRVRTVRAESDGLFKELETTIWKLKDGDKPGAFAVVKTDYGEKQITNIIFVLNECVVAEEAKIEDAAGNAEMLFRMFLTLFVTTCVCLTLASLFAWQAYHRRRAERLFPH